MTTVQTLKSAGWVKDLYWGTLFWGMMSLAGAIHIFNIADFPAFHKVFSLVLWSGLLLVYFSHMIPGFPERILVENPNGRLIVFFALTLFYAIFILYANTAQQLTANDLWIGAAYLALPVLLAFLIRTRPLRLSFPDALLILLIWFPIEFGILPEINIPFRQGLVKLYHLYGIILAMIIFLAIRRIPDLGLRIAMTRQEIVLAVKLSAIFFIVFAIPIGFSTGFIHWQVDAGSIWKWIAGILGTAFFIAFPEEILFRGIIQNMIEKRLEGRPETALIIASVIFGLAHANNPNPPYWNLDLGSLGMLNLPWVYIVLATIAGWFYGKAYQKTGSIAAAALVHTIVDCIWWMFFAG